MYPWLWIWNPQLHFPWSGSVAQRIEPNWFFDAIPPEAGDGQIEQKAFAVASYGKQLGLITEVLLQLAEQQPGQELAGSDALRRLKAINEQIKALKGGENPVSAQALEQQITRLKQQDPAEFERLAAQLRPLLEE